MNPELFTPGTKPSNSQQCMKQRSKREEKDSRLLFRLHKINLSKSHNYKKNLYSRCRH